MRTFIACPVERNSLSEEILYDLSQIKGVSPVRTPELHITLHFIGDTSENVATDIKIGLIKLRFPAFRVEMSGVGCFPSAKSPRVIFIGVKGFQEDLYDATMKAAGMESFDRKFVPHITIARIRQAVDIRNLLKKYEGVRFGFPEINRVCYYRSALKPGGPVYTEITCVQLM
ncbi:MAG: RNA 2',3'-cyclic phosphodiesterase [Thermoplasmataceae archaeon]